MMNAAYGVSVVNLRLFMVYGPGQHDRSKLVPYTITSLLDGRRPSLSGGTRLVDWIYVDDVVDALIAGAACTQGDDGSPIDVGSGALVTIREIVSIIGSELGSPLEPSFDTGRDRPNEMQGSADLTRAAQLLGWAPGTSLTEGLRAAVAWYKSHPAAGT
jgi:nucleoside-diphosphate-sugar epimerase